MANEFDLEDPEVMNAIKEAASTQTPDQLQNTFEDAGVDLNRFTGANDSGQGGYDPASDYSNQPPPPPPAQPNDYSQPFYSRLERGPDGTLQGVGQGTIYDRQGIAARNLASGNLSPASDLYQEQAGGPARPQSVQQEPPSIDQQIAQLKLNQFQEAQLTQAEHGAAVTAQKLMAGSITSRDAANSMAVYNQVIDNYRSRQAMVAQLTRQKSEEEFAKQRARNTGMDQTDFDIAYEKRKKLADGTEAMFLGGKIHILGKAGAAIADQKAMAAQEGAYFKAYYAAVKQADSDMRKLIGKDEKGHDIPFNTEHYAQRDKIVAETLAKHGYAPTWEEQKQKIGGVQGQSQQGISGGVSGATPGGTLAGPQEAAPPAPKPFTKVEAKVADQSFDKDMKAIQAMEGVPAIVKTNAVMAMQGMKELLAKHNNDPSKFSDEESKMFFYYRKSLMQLQTPKPAPAPTPAAPPVSPLHHGSFRGP